MKREGRMRGFFKVAITFATLLATPHAVWADLSERTWAGLKADIVGDRQLQDGSAIIALEAPVRAEDAAITPIDIIALKPQTADAFIKKLTLVVDENPGPVAAAFTLGPASPNASISTRVRVEGYSYVRVIAEMNDGAVYMVKRYVKASGGCSAPAGKDHDKAMAEMGKMKLRQFPVSGGETTRDAQIMIRHPNYSGLQMDQITRHYTPAHFVRDVQVTRGGDLVFRMEGGISLSEDPNIRFRFAPGAGEIKVTAKDTENNEWAQSWAVEAQGS
jgi:sulfur-oxidizing protein SoxY